MSTFAESVDTTRPGLSVDKDNPTVEDVKAAEGGSIGSTVIPADNAGEPVPILEESHGERSDRHIASTELKAYDVTDPASQSYTPLAQQTGNAIVPGAAVGPDNAGVIRNDAGKVAHAPAGSLDAAFNGVQEDASGHVDSVGTDNSTKSGVRI